MGLNLVKNKAKIRQDFFNNVTQVSNNSCRTKSVANVSNNVIGISVGNVQGDFTGISNAGSADASCVIASTLDAQIDTLLNSISSQITQVKSSLFGDFQWNKISNKFKLRESIKNNISQVMEATCEASNISSFENNYTFITAKNVGGNFIGISNSSNVKSGCSMENYAKAITFNLATTGSHQQDDITGMWVALVGSIGGIILMIVIFVIVLLSIGAIGYFGYKAIKKSKTAEGAEGISEGDVNGESDTTSIKGNNGSDSYSINKETVNKIKNYFTSSSTNQTNPPIKNIAS